MQTIQLLPERAGFFAAARAHLAPGGLLAIAIAAALEDFGELERAARARRRRGRRRGASRPSRPPCARSPPRRGSSASRRAFAPDGRVTEEDDVIELAHLTVAQLEAEGRAAGPDAGAARARSPRPTEHVGSEVVLLRG